MEEACCFRALTTTVHTLACCTHMIRNYVQVSLLRHQERSVPEILVMVKIRKSSMILIHRAVSRDVGMRNTRENMIIPGSVFDCQHARRDAEELHNDSRNLAISLAILRTEGIENSVWKSDHDGNRWIHGWNEHYHDDNWMAYEPLGNEQLELEPLGDERMERRRRVQR